MFQCNVSADLFRRALSCVSTEETRYYLNGVNIEPATAGASGALLVSTDGARMICLRDPEGKVTGCGIVSTDAATQKAINGKLAERVVVADNVVRVLDSTDRTIHIQTEPALIDGTFPMWRRVVPKSSGEKRAADTFDILKLAPLAKALGLTGKTAVAAIYSDDTPGAPAVVIGSALIDGFGIIMPVRCARDFPSMPLWADHAASLPPECAEPAESETVAA